MSTHSIPRKKATLLITMRPDRWYHRPAVVWSAIIASHVAACALVWWLA